MYTPSALLDGAIKKLTDEKGDLVVSTFFEEAEALAVEGNRLVVKVPTDLVRSVLEQRFAVDVADIISDIAGQRMRVEFLSDPAQYKKYEQSKSQLPSGYSGYTFDSFIVGNSNKLAHAAAMAVANGLSQPDGAPNAASAIYNPLFIYGQSGLGKTHLLYAMMEMITTHRFDKKVIYIKGDEFTNQLVRAIEDKNVPAFRDKYRGADLLLVDDIQFIAGKERTQEEFFHTFNHLYEAGKQIVLTSDRPPKEMATLQERLSTRFEWGLLTDIQPPDLETRMALVNVKASNLGVQLPVDVTEYIASCITSNVRQLEGAVKKLAALHSIMNIPIDIDLAQRAIKDIFKESPGLNPTPQLILEEVSSFTGVAKDKILGKSKSKDIVHARQMMIYLITQMTDLSLPAIGRFIGRDHTTALYARDKIAEEIQTNPGLDATIKDLMKNIRSR
ncbi:MAG: chromosomal replication initiator protein DnaA [Clostridia bacterium]|nr:chromosomal replication initiator protein DnaA [Clostridia bacterium]MBR5283516.1 chromosomal replication initiator protein DnaA [Clostridia bacterium]